MYEHYFVTMLQAGTGIAELIAQEMSKQVRTYYDTEILGFKLQL